MRQKKDTGAQDTRAGAHVLGSKHEMGERPGRPDPVRGSHVVVLEILQWLPLALRIKSRILTWVAGPFITCSYLPPLLLPIPSSFLFLSLSLSPLLSLISSWPELPAWTVTPHGINFLSSSFNSCHSRLPLNVRSSCAFHDFLLSLSNLGLGVQAVCCHCILYSPLLNTYRTSKLIPIFLSKG